MVRKMFVRITNHGLLIEREPRMERFEKEFFHHTQKTASKFFKIPIHQVQQCKKGWKNPKTGEVIW